MRSLQDLAWVWQGIQRRPVSTDEAFLLDPVDIHRGGTKRALLLLHGFASTPAVFRRMLPLLNHYDGVVCPVLPGHAESVARLAEIRAEDWVECARAHCKMLCERYEHVDVLGLSLGGVLACDLSQHFKLHHLYLLSPALYLTFPWNFGKWLAWILLALGIRSVRHQGGNMYGNQGLDISYRRLPMTVMYALFSYLQAFRIQAPHCPLDVFLGWHDGVINGFMVERACRFFPETHIHWLKQSAHVLPLDNDWKKIIEVMKAG